MQDVFILGEDRGIERDDGERASSDVRHFFNDILEFEINDLHHVKLTTKSKIPLYVGSELSRLIGSLVILNTCTTHRCTNGFVDELLSLL